mmetsp:Transcript_19300/g.36047  ORF Transcript_19300/g.36047 Transcript_19300/m.36047 type:complete len:457 (+) Transcript_19300:171-1541(+)|eukprot:CAMPEP_0201669150 /NCGR_PEP_ID=MMETSP0494-20130426/22521_1 /ASSEMBLY_ACC=CAM_ASM_000839 /TAXON_ID=420259 /ORGANISM="Thalassiosira gravida, Strain GMp14c1" /LENGTH=456 /DNA_ID=CAMNT_0048149819 /DNA_START=156 /DNA_END=1526 /DNA_ORIENTATION=-
MTTTKHGHARRRRGSLIATYASTFLHIQYSASFQMHQACLRYSSRSPLLPLRDLRPSRKYYSSKIDDDPDRTESSNFGRVFNEKSILGETLDDVNLRDGTYSWVNPKSIPNDNNIRQQSDNQPSSSSKSSSSSAADDNNAPSPEKDRYKRIEFDGCGSILLHHEPESNNDNSSHDADYETSSGRHKRTGLVLWSASYVISYYIDAQWSKGGSWYRDGSPSSSSNSNDLGRSTKKRWTVLELGAGLGLCSAVAAKHGMNVVSTDNDSAALALLKDNLRRNRIRNDDDDHRRPRSPPRAHVHSLDWVATADDPLAESSHPVFSRLESPDDGGDDGDGGADLILLSDVIYGATKPAWSALLTLLCKFRAQRRRIRSAKRGGNSNDEDRGDNDGDNDDNDDPLVLLGYTQRRRDMSPRDEALFFAMVREAGMEVALVPSTSIPNGEKYLLTSLFRLRWVG